jgi:hypothetical protein
MRFVVSRTSYSNDPRPCPEAVEVDGVYVEERCVSSPEQLHPRLRAKWPERGLNHRVEGGHIKRDIPITQWVVQLDSLEDLVAFISRHGKVVITESFELEIYDGYRE